MIPFPDKKYNIIYADPAWTFKTWSDKGEEKGFKGVQYKKEEKTQKIMKGKYGIFK